MKNILILGAGLSASSMIRYLLNLAQENDWHLKIVDQDIELVKQSILEKTIKKSKEKDDENNQ
jgi:NADH dehydrogenase FAD-containing subunit